MNYDSPDTEIQISQVEEYFIEALFEGISDAAINQEQPARRAEFQTKIIHHEN